MRKVTIYIKPKCPFCKKALLELSREGVKPTVIDITGNAALKNKMISESSRSTVPQIFIGDTHLGGCDDLLAAQKSGNLKEMLA
ncbi:hypothetical protein LCGC14_1557960 [marine sediment metagenome]|uniref:Glutaredoxin domain-containing protein n=1 Tax=marine sediment metagenome TaxID=412755 RepID=A0A0F9IND9_9ZZZZ